MLFLHRLSVPSGEDFCRHNHRVYKTNSANRWPFVELRRMLKNVILLPAEKLQFCFQLVTEFKSGVQNQGQWTESARDLIPEQYYNSPQQATYYFIFML